MRVSTHGRCALTMSRFSTTVRSSWSVACIFTWAEPLVQWLFTQPQLATFEHDGYPGGEVRLGASDATLMSCSYLGILSYILTCNDGQWARACPFAGFLYLCLSASELRAKRGPHQGETPPSKP